jgi:hypothetical protein
MIPMIPSASTSTSILFLLIVLMQRNNPSFEPHRLRIFLSILCLNSTFMRVITSSISLIQKSETAGYSSGAHSSEAGGGRPELC